MNRVRRTRQRISVHKDQVGELARFQAAFQLFLMMQIRIVDRVKAYGLLASAFRP